MNRGSCGDTTSNPELASPFCYSILPLILVTFEDLDVTWNDRHRRRKRHEVMDHLLDSPTILKARAMRNERIIRERGIHESGDESAIGLWTSF